MLIDQHLHEDDPELWARTHFAKARMGLFTRTCRVEAIAAAMARSPGVSIPQLFDRTYDVEATYSLLNHQTATPENLQHGHRAWVRDQLTRPGTYLLIEDTTTMSFSHRLQAVPGLAAVGDGADGRQGFFLHSVLTVRLPETPPRTDAGTLRTDAGVVVVGLADQQSYTRVPRPAHEALGCGVKARADRPRESQRWTRSTTRLGPAPADPQVRWIRVADAEADIHDYFGECIKNGHQFVVRLCQSRAVLDEESRDHLGSIREAAAKAAAVTSYRLELRTRPDQPARTAELSVSFGRICVRAPAHHGAGAEPVSFWFVRAWEAAAPATVDKPLEWLLACGSPVESPEEALRAVWIYAHRPIIEDFHKGLKTGMGAERLQLETGARLMAATALMSVVTLRLLGLRERARITPGAPATESGLDALECELLSRRLDRRLETVRDVLLAVGRLGGHMNRKADGLPGWLTLHRGMKQLRLMVAGARLMSQPPPPRALDEHG